MALHVEQQILDAVQALLAAGATMAEEVYLDRLDPLPRGVRRAILIREGDNGDDVEPATIKDLQQRDMEVEIACALRNHDGVAAEARAFGLEVEKILSSAPASLRALCKSGWRLTNSRLQHRGEGEEQVAARVQLWRFTYLVRKATPDVVA